MTLRDYGQDCMRSGCHGGLDERPWTHAPVAVAACETCHEPVGSEDEHRFQGPRDDKELCTFCHKAPRPELHVHPAFANSSCLRCHDPHGAANHALLRVNDGNVLCSQCHPAHVTPGVPGEERPEPLPDAPKALHGTQDYAYVHPPLLEGRCLECHNAHQSSLERLLNFPGSALCTQCHEELIGDAAYVHEPVGSDCRACHSAHGGSDSRMLREPPNELCSSCHPAVRLELQQGVHAHGALESGEGCLNCHEPHSAAHEGLLSRPAIQLCYSCHDQEIPRPSGAPVPDVKTAVQSAAHVHAPLVEGSCVDCHRPHASPFPSLLAAEYPFGAYTRYSEGAYAACLACHDPQMVSDETFPETGFRDGDRNLHYVHVHRAKGRSCALCHEPHASSEPRLMRREMPFGDWALPLGFELTPTGGRCAGSCHKTQVYKNERTPRPPPREGSPPRR